MSSKLRFDIRLRHRMAGRDLVLNVASEAKVTALVGPSGIGKTTMLNCIAGLIKPDTGRVAVDGALLFDSATDVNLSPEQRGAGYVFQDMRLFPHMKVAKNLRYGVKNKGARAQGKGGPQAEEITEMLGLDGLLDRWPDSLSGGEKRRVAIGRALLAGPKFLALDEPLSSLDDARARNIEAMIMRISDALDLPILIVSHDMAQVERLATHVAQMGDMGGSLN